MSKKQKLTLEMIQKIFKKELPSYNKSLLFECPLCKFNENNENKLVFNIEKEKGGINELLQ